MPRFLLLLVALFPLLAGCQPYGRVSNIIALFTDFGSGDPYVAQLKGAIKSLRPSADIMDLSHDNAAFDISTASYILAKSTRTLPPGTVIIAVVDPGVGSGRGALVLRTNAGRIYIAPDNGILTEVIAREGLADVRLLQNEKLRLPGTTSATFHARDIFGPAAAHILGNSSIESCGPKAEKILRLPRNTATVMANLAKGQILYIDHYGNILTNIPGSEIGKLKTGQLLSVAIKGRNVSLPFLRTYAEAPADRPFALINSDGELEIAIGNGNAAHELGAKVGDPVVLKL
ncbi:MAG: SAM-dependent chlorinase/fluorinase [Verrucomicrobia bacterium]|nr:SAM-dependent chlorinase/fluorinase [Verrucomicrobiota bacterium]